MGNATLNCTFPRMNDYQATPQVIEGYKAVRLLNGKEHFQNEFPGDLVRWLWDETHDRWLWVRIPDKHFSHQFAFKIFNVLFEKDRK